jgi:hypothetical protein
MVCRSGQLAWATLPDEAAYRIDSCAFRRPLARSLIAEPTGTCGACLVEQALELPLAKALPPGIVAGERSGRDLVEYGLAHPRVVEPGRLGDHGQRSVAVAGVGGEVGEQLGDDGDVVAVLVDVAGCGWVLGEQQRGRPEGKR